MKSERWKQIDKLFSEALNLDIEKRQAFLDEVCSGDETLRKEIESLLQSDQQSSDLIHASPAPIAADLLAPQRLDIAACKSIAAGTQLAGRYEILAPLGAGGMGEVYRARDLRLGRDVAIKVLPEHLSNDPLALARFEREAKAVAALSHPNILAIHDFGSDQAVSFAVMELLDGETLRDRLRRSAVPWPKTIEFSVAIANALSAAHSKGIIHRDLKPENIFITSDGNVRILDFGLARWKRKEPSELQTSAPTISQTEPGTIMGTMPYMSPEQIRGEDVDARSDIFSFGAVLYEMVSGKGAFRRKTSADTISAVLNEHPPEVSASGKIVPPDLERIIVHCLEKKPQERFQSAGDLAYNLKAVSTISGVTLPSRISFPKVRSVVWIIPFLLVLFVGIFVYLFFGRGKAMNSLAILPFINASSDPNTEYLSDGMTESMINHLSQLPKLKVMARSTVFHYKGKKMDPRKVGRDLSVDAVLTGSMIQQGDMLKISAELVNVADGSQIWGQQYNRNVAEIFEVQDEISKEIADKLRLKLTGEQTKRLAKHYTENPEAYQSYLKGMYHWYKSTEEDYEKARDYFQQALEKDPSYALAYVGISRYYGGVIMDGYSSPKEMWPKFEAAARKALEIDQSLSHGKYQIAVKNFYHDWNWAAAARVIKQIIDQDPNDPLFHHLYSYILLVTRRNELAIKEIKITESLDPLSLVFSVNVGQILSMIGRHDEAIQQLNKTLEMNPNYDVALFSLVDVYQRKRMYEEASELSERAHRLLQNESAAELFAEADDKESYQEATRILAHQILDQLLELSQERYVSPLDIASIYSQLNEKEEAFLWLEKAYQERSGQLVFLNVKSDWDPIRSDPRFTDLVKRIGLPYRQP